MAPRTKRSRQSNFRRLLRQLPDFNAYGIRKAVEASGLENLIGFLCEYELGPSKSKEQRWLHMDSSMPCSNLSSCPKTWIHSSLSIRWPRYQRCRSQLGWKGWGLSSVPFRWYDRAKIRRLTAKGTDPSAFSHSINPTSYRKIWESIQAWFPSALRHLFLPTYQLGESRTW